MAKFYTELNETLRQFIGAQQMFFNASAPNQGRINLSPKGLDTFRVLSDQRVAYLDLTGSECETAAHLAENGRLTLMFCSFQDKPLILRLYGRGSVVRPPDAQWPELRAHFPPLPGERQIIVLDIESIMTTCGFAVPLFEYKAQRELLPEFTCKMGEERMDAYRHERNQTSIDGLPTHLFDDPPK
ncbi:pyridoxamine 5'-phosphate oxidase [Planctomycetaceae bacterium SCGC AG-212-F19]|nr:pyridoxamine 5'-phosphate oxidase [Planctomycetaceae bacterium SCGC AG-212-F19]